MVDWFYSLVLTSAPKIQYQLNWNILLLKDKWLSIWLIQYSFYLFIFQVVALIKESFPGLAFCQWTPVYPYHLAWTVLVQLHLSQSGLGVLLHHQIQKLCRVNVVWHPSPSLMKTLTLPHCRPPCNSRGRAA